MIISAIICIQRRNSEFMPATIVPLDTYNRTQQLADYLLANTSVPLIYIRGISRMLV